MRRPDSNQSQTPGSGGPTARSRAARAGLAAVWLAGASVAASHAAAADLLAPAPVAVAPTIPDASLLSPAPIATEKLWGLAVFFGSSGGQHDMHQLLIKPWLLHPEDYVWSGVAVNRRIGRFWTDFSVELEGGVGHRFGPRYSGNEAWVATFVRYDGFFWNDRLYTTLAASTGLNYLDSFPREELASRRRSHILHYFAPELTFALPDHKEHEFVFRFHHRSGVFGTFNGVWGGSNVVSVGYRHRF
ncbi:hypothetical protein C2U72_11995 [Prosthecomicrobium hirschii]|uniref:hypothetical protein n=1 Tax=Prosthecodimorpha hirschii TaxID=665126 RepID=UPI0011263C61|nr:hypothetical protein [Prosthecomicrobium hirschii]TPQ50724.1 hypothetical protein C2U72_11995 [Prosthecomicrobium hirschii]